MKKKIFIIIFLLIMLILGLGVTYSAFSTKSRLIINQEIASFIFETSQTDHISLALSNLKPGDKNEYKFSVSNNRKLDKKTDISNVTINYQILLSTYHFMPLEIELYKKDIEEPILICNEKISRNEKNIIVCTTEIQNMKFDSEITDDYTLKVKFDEKCNTEEYADLIDSIDIEIKSWQKVGES